MGFRRYCYGLSFAMLPLLMVACDGAGNSSRPSGHYEGMDKSTALALIEAKPVVIPEYEETGSVIVSLELFEAYDRFDLAEAVLAAGVDLTVVVPAGFDGRLPGQQALDKAAGTRARIRLLEAEANVPVVWARDWGPLAARTATGDLTLLDFNYYNDRPDGDAVPSFMEPDGLPRISVPVYNEGGNFMINSRGDCVMTRRVVEANQDFEVPYQIDASGRFRSTLDPELPLRRGTPYIDLQGQVRIRDRTEEHILSEADIIDHYERFAGCRRTIMLDRMPGEGTGHVDMFAKFLDDDTVLMGAFTEEQLAGVKDSTEESMAREMHAYLQTVRGQLEKAGFTIVTVPMPVPQKVVGSGGEISFMVRSYTNSLLLNKDGERSVLVPRYERKVTLIANRWIRRSDYSDDAALDGYEEAARRAYEKAGFRVTFITTDVLIAFAGSVHCVTMQVGRRSE